MTFVKKADLVNALNGMLKSNDIVLVKGSRGMALEDVINGLI